MTWLSPYGWPQPDCVISRYLSYPRFTEEENRAALKRLGEWWRWKQYHARFDRCCHR